MSLILARDFLPNIMKTLPTTFFDLPHAFRRYGVWMDNSPEFGEAMMQFDPGRSCTRKRIRFLFFYSS